MDDGDVAVVCCDVGFSCDAFSALVVLVASVLRGVEVDDDDDDDDDGNGVEEDNDGDCIDGVLIALLVMVLSLLHSLLHFLLDSTLLSVGSLFVEFFVLVECTLHSVRLAFSLVLSLEPHSIITLWIDFIVEFGDVEAGDNGDDSDNDLAGDIAIVVVVAVTGAACVISIALLVVVAVVNAAAVFGVVIPRLCTVVVAAFVVIGCGPHSVFLRAVVVNVIVIFILLLLFFDRWQ